MNTDDSGFIYLDCVDTYDKAVEIVGEKNHLIIEGTIMFEQ